MCVCVSVCLSVQIDISNHQTISILPIICMGAENWEANLVTGRLQPIQSGPTIPWNQKTVFRKMKCWYTHFECYLSGLKEGIWHAPPCSNINHLHFSEGAILWMKSYLPTLRYVFVFTSCKHKNVCRCLNLKTRKLPPRSLVNYYICNDPSSGLDYWI